MELLHHLNIGLHILFGSVGLLLGLVPMFSRHGGARHIRFGRWFLRVLTVVLATAVLGLAVFNFRPFLAIVVMLTVYQAWSGYRVMRTRTTGPTHADAAFSAVFLLGSIGFLLTLHLIDLVWSPVVIYSSLGFLIALTIYDLARFAFVPLWRRKLWLYDHIWKMISSYFALVSAFTGTVLAQYQPYSQFLPSMVGTALGVSFILYYALRRAPARPLAGSAV
ncbi:hypothetical protein [Hymenobacter koreensis]|uniref:DUF2306 domain-containing protein n=1 Tax=Hymenobacter koreensis TaxID=1084523 RepID=A0ABP8J4Q0_9BACT